MLKADSHGFMRPCINLLAQIEYVRRFMSQIETWVDLWVQIQHAGGFVSANKELGGI